MDTENPTETKALQVPEPPPIRSEEPTGEGDVGERVATLGHSFASESMMHHYHLSTHHVFQTRRSDIRSETLHWLRRGPSSRWPPAGERCRYPDSPNTF